MLWPKKSSESRGPNQHGQIEYQLTGGNHRDEKIPADTMALVDGYITITALHFNMTDYERNRQLEQIDWSGWQ